MSIGAFTPLPRAGEAELRLIMRSLPVAVVTGPRQCGKSVLASTTTETKGHLYVSLDSPDELARALDDPAAFIRRAPRMVIDEVQRAPELMLAIKQAVDAEGQAATGRFVLTGSANLLLHHRVSDSLAGRAGYVTLHPMTRREREGVGRVGEWGRLLDTAPDEWTALISASDRPPADWKDEVRIGGFPRPALALAGAERDAWYRNYETTYLERDLRDLRSVERLVDFRRFMQAMALRLGSNANISDIARDLGLEARTLRRWADLLEISYQLVRVPAYSRRRTTRLRVRPRHYWVDSALALHIAREREPRGAHLETLVLSELRAWAALDHAQPTVHYWQDDANREVDFVVERGGKALAIEVKASARIHVDDWKHLRHFTETYAEECHGALLLHGGTEVTRLGDRMVAVPWWAVL